MRVYLEPPLAGWAGKVYLLIEADPEGLGECVAFCGEREAEVVISGGTAVKYGGETLAFSSSAEAVRYLKSLVFGNREVNDCAGDEEPATTMS